MRYLSFILPAAFALICCSAIAQAPHAKSRDITPSSCSDKKMTNAEVQKERAALERFNANDLSSARPILVELAQEYPCRYELQAAAGMALAQFGESAAASPFLRQAHRLHPKDDAISFNLALVDIKNENFESAAKLLNIVANRNPLRADVQIALGSAYAQSRQPALAAEAYRKAAANLAANNQAVPLELRMDWASALINSRQAPAACHVLEGADGLQRSAPALEMLAEAEESAGNFESAARDFEHAARLDPSEQMILAYGNELLQHRTFGPAIEILKYGVGRFPSSERMHLALGAAYFNNGSYDLAAPEFYDLLIRSPQNTLAADMLGRSCSYSTAASLQACTALENFSQQHPENPVAATYAATAILQRPVESRDILLAERLLQSAVHTDPKLADAWYQLGVIQQSRNQWQVAATSLERATSLQPDFADAHYRLSRSYVHMGRRDDAVAEVNLEMKYRQQAKDANSLRMQNIVRFLTAEKQP